MTDVTVTVPASVNIAASVGVDAVSATVATTSVSCSVGGGGASNGLHYVVTQTETALPNSTVAGDVITHNNSEFVHVTNDETIANTKTFTGDVLMKSGRPWVDVRAYGAGSANGTTTFDDTPVANAIAALVAQNGGTLFFPAGNYYFASPIDLSGGHSISVVGASPPSAGASVPTILRYTGTGTQFIKATGTVGIVLDKLMLLYSSGSFTGRIVDLSGSTAYCRVQNCYLGNAGGTRSAAAAIYLDTATNVMVSNCAIQDCVVGIYGKATNGSYSNVVTVEQTHFINMTTASVKNAGQAWEFIGCAFEYLVGGGAGAYTHASGVRAEGVTFSNCWFGDITATGTTQIKWSGDALTLSGSYLGFNDQTTFLSIDENGCNGIVVVGNKFQAAGSTSVIGINFGTTTGHTGFVETGNAWNGVATHLTGGVPGGSIVQTAGTANEWYDTPFSGLTNLLTADQASVETSTAGWGSWDITKASAARSAAAAADGSHSMALTTIVAGPQDVRLSGANPTTPALYSQVAVSPNTTYTATMLIAPGGACRTVDMFVECVKSDGTLSVLTGTQTTSATALEVPGKWTRVSVEFTTVADAAYVHLVGRVYSTVLNEVHYFDKFAVFLGSVNVGYFDNSGSVPGLLAGNNLSDVSSSATSRTNLGLGTVATLASDTDGTLAANSDSVVATQKAVKTYADTQDALRAPVYRKFKTGYYYVCGDNLQNSDTTKTLTLNQLEAVPMVIPTSTSFDQVSLEVTATVASSVVLIGIWNDNSGVPGSLRSSLASLDTHTTTGIITQSISLTLPAGIYWVGNVTQGGASGPTVRARGGITSLVPQTTGGNVNAVSLQQASVTGSLPDPFVVGAHNQTACAKVMLRVA